MSWVATAIVGAGAATGAGQYFSNKKVKPALATAPHIIGIEDTPLGKTINQRITDALTKGSNIGFPADYVDKTTSPFVASREARYKSKELPALSAEYAGRGLGRSSLAARDIGESFAQKERDVNEIIANAVMADLQQKKTDTQRYENLGTDYARDNANAFNAATSAAAGIDYQNQNALQGYNEASRQNMASSINTSLDSILTGLKIGNKNTDGSDLSSLIAYSNYLNASPFTSKAPAGATSYGGGAYGKTTPYYLSPKWQSTPKSPSYA